MCFFIFCCMLCVLSVIIYSFDKRFVWFHFNEARFDYSYLKNDIVLSILIDRHIKKATIYIYQLIYYQINKEQTILHNC